MREVTITAENGGVEANEHKDMVIGLQDDTLNLRDMPVDETDAYRRDVLTRPEVVSHCPALPGRMLISCTVHVGRLLRGPDRSVW